MKSRFCTSLLENWTDLKLIKGKRNRSQGKLKSNQAYEKNSK